MRMTTPRSAPFTLSTLAAALALPAGAQTTIGFDDFDTSVQGTDYASRSFTPDNSGNFSFDGVTPGVFPGSNFDLFGITNRNVNFDWADDTQNGFPGDTNGFAGVGANDPGNFVGIADLVNNDNPSGIGEATWTFDITGYENITVSLDAVAWGDFETDDIFLFEASIDGGAATTVFNGTMTQAQDDANTPYLLTMDDGTTPDRAPLPFYVQAEYDFLVANQAAILAQADPTVPELEFDPDGTPGNGDEIKIAFSSLDDGVTNGDTTALDGFVPNTGAAGTFEEMAYSVENDFGIFDEIENAPFVDPLFEQVSDTQLTNELQTFTTAVAGTGDTLTLTLLAASNGGGEQFGFDNIVIEGELIGGSGIEGDYDDGGQVEQTDLDFVLSNWGDTDISDVTGWVNFPGGGAFDGLVDQNELDGVLLNWGSTSAPDFSGSNVPEPTSLAVLAGLGALALRRRSA